MVAFTRKLNKSSRVSVRKQGNRPKGAYHTLRRTMMSHSANNTRRVKTVLTENERRKHKMDKRIAREWKAVIEEINEPEIRENIGLYINGNGKLVSTEGEITVEQYGLLIDELETKLDSPDTDYEEKILVKAIKFVRRERKQHLRNLEMNSLTGMMARL
jgi:hypothetical protein